MRRDNKIKERHIALNARDLEALSFISAGVACYAFSLIDELGLLAPLYQNGKLSIRTLSSFPNPLVLHSAFETLLKNDVIKYDDGFFHLTSLGKALFLHRGSIGLIYNGYRNILANQLCIATDEPSSMWGLVDSLAVAKASVSFGESAINDLIMDVLLNTPYRGLCDLGCGEAIRLLQICRKFKMEGYGFDLSDLAIQKAKKSLKKSDRITLSVNDVTKLGEKIPNIEILMQSFVMHDIVDDFYKITLQSFHEIFPDLKMFIYIDAFAPEDVSSLQLPGFDYIHSLLNIKTRTKKETLKIAKNCGFYLEGEYLIPGLPNCYLLVFFLKKPTM